MGQGRRARDRDGHMRQKEETKRCEGRQREEDGGAKEEERGRKRRRNGGLRREREEEEEEDSGGSRWSNREVAVRRRRGQMFTCSDTYELPEVCGASTHISVLEGAQFPP